MTNYGTVIDNRLHPAPRAFMLNGAIVTNPKAEHFTALNEERSKHGLPPYLPIVDERPTTDAAHYAVATGWTRDGETWRRVYEVRELPPPPPRTFSKYKLVGALLRAGVWPQVKEWLLSQVPKVREFLWDELGLELHQGKIHIQEVHKGVEFLGTFVKPYREYVSNRTLERMQKKLQQVNLRNREAALRSVNSYLGIMSHTASYNLRRSMFGEGEFAEMIEYDADMRKGWLAA